MFITIVWRSASCAWCPADSACVGWGGNPPSTVCRKRLGATAPSPVRWMAPTGFLLLKTQRVFQALPVAAGTIHSSILSYSCTVKHKSYKTRAFVTFQRALNYWLGRSKIFVGLQKAEGGKGTRSTMVKRAAWCTAKNISPATACACIFHYETGPGWRGRVRRATWKEWQTKSLFSQFHGVWYRSWLSLDSFISFSLVQGYWTLASNQRTTSMKQVMVKWGLFVMLGAVGNNKPGH